jgi:hypothetical protein
MESEHVAQNEDGELPGRQNLKGGHEGEGDGFGLLIAGFRAKWHIDRTLEKGVGKRLQPYNLAEPGRLRSVVELRERPTLWRVVGWPSGAH